MPEIICHTLFTFIHINFVLRIRKKERSMLHKRKKYRKPSRISIFCGLSYSFNSAEHIFSLWPPTLPKVNFRFFFSFFAVSCITHKPFFNYAFEERFMKLLVKNMTYLWYIYKSGNTNILCKRVCVSLRFVSWYMFIFFMA